jgi:sugar transferase EpsL
VRDCGEVRPDDVKLVHIVTVPQSHFHLTDQVRFMRDRGFEVHSIDSPDPALDRFGSKEGIPASSVKMPWRFRPLSDLVAVVRLVRILRKIHPAIAQIHSPKGGLLGMIAAFLAGVPVRIYTLHGLPHETARGLRRALLRWTGKISCLMASEVIPVGPSLRRLGIAEGLASAAKGTSLPNRRRPLAPPRLVRQRPIPILIKRVMDVAVSLLVLILASPVLALAALWIRLSMGNPIFFRQRRPGQGGDPFTVLKFRTMDPGTQPDEHRVTKLGRLLRAASVDELPQLWNVLRGDMSLVGPRPLLMQYLDRYSPEQARRHEMKPGLTGWAQVHGRNTLNWEERFRLDLWYVDRWSLALDLWTLCLTVGKVLSRSDIVGTGDKAVSEFMGSPKVLSTRSEPLVEIGSRA